MYRCICDHGYEVDPTGKVCSDVNECEMQFGLICSGGETQHLLSYLAFTFLSYA